jgi:hypothetical protein
VHEVVLADVGASGVERAVAFAVVFDAGVECVVVAAIGGACGADDACVVVGVAVVVVIVGDARFAVAVGIGVVVAIS